MTISIVMALAIGYQAPATGWIEALHLDDCELPCWIGIQPGETSVRDAAQRVKDVFADSYYIDQIDATRLELTHKALGYRFAVYFPNARIQPLISEIHFYRLFDRNGRSPEVSELGSVLSAPVKIHPDYDSTSLYYPKYQVIISMLRAWNPCPRNPDGFYSISAKVSIHRTIESFVISPNVPQQATNIGRRWRGFGACHTVKYR